MRSRFAIALDNIINSDSYLSKRDWITFLFSSNDEIEQWLKDESLPEDYQLKALVDIVTSLSTKNTQKSLDEFIQLLKSPVVEVTPIKQEYNTLNEYMLHSEFRV